MISSIVLAAVIVPAIYNFNVSWIPPTKRTDGTALTNLHHFDVYRGECGGDLSVVKTVPVGTNATQVSTPRGTYCWAVTAVDSKGVVSELSNIQVALADTDTDNDGVPDYADNCTLVVNPDQVDSDADGFGNRCDGDLNGDKITNAFDTAIYRTLLGTPSVPPVYSPADFNVNGYVNAFDTPLFRQMLGHPPGPSGPLP